jgi:flagellar basal-body rod protein FlgG
MDRGLYIAASGMLAELSRQDRIADQLANASTPGFKPERSTQRSFGDLLLSNQASGSYVGALGMGAQIVDVKPDLTQGPLRETSEPLDFALEGDGFFAVRTQDGTRYTRDGQFTLDAKRQLVTSTGGVVLDAKGSPITLPAGDPAVGADGNLTVAGKPVATIGVVTLTNPQRAGDTYFTGTASGGRPATTNVRQRFLEGSAVDPARVMVDMITSMRAYESVQRAIHTIDDSLGKGINGGGQ